MGVARETGPPLAADDDERMVREVQDADPTPTALRSTGTRVAADRHRFVARGPAALPSAQVELDVVEVGDERLREVLAGLRPTACDIVEHGATVQHQGTGRPEHLARLIEAAVIRLPRPTVEQESRARQDMSCRVDDRRSVGRARPQTQQLGLDGPAAWVLVEHAHHHGDRVRIDRRVGVDEQHRIGVRRADPEVHRTAEAMVVRQGPQHQRMATGAREERLHARDGVIAAGVVEHHDLEGVMFDRLERGEAASDVARRVPRDDDRGHAAHVSRRLPSARATTRATARATAGRWSVRCRRILPAARRPRRGDCR